MANKYTKNTLKIKYTKNEMPLFINKNFRD